MAGDAKHTRDDRLKAALKANMARRKAQKRTRADADAPKSGPVSKETKDG